MNLRLFVPIGLGVCSVIQAGLNRRVASKFDLSSATLMNNAVLFGLSALIFFATTRGKSSSASGSFEAWQFLPGFLGICLVAGIPWAISKWGTTAVFVGLITSQVVSSVAWDWIVEGKRLGAVELSGAFLSVVGMLFMNVKK